MRELAPRLLDLAKANATAYRTARPFPYAVLDDVLPHDVLEAALDEWPGPDEIDWTRYDDANERKNVSTDVRQLGPHLRGVLEELNSRTFVDFLEELTGITGLVADPSYAAAGISDVPDGGFLNPHSDFLLHGRTHLDRRINVLLYLNRDWTDANGGQFELWDAKKRQCVERILPVFNRMVIFNTTGKALHGHTQRVAAPEGGSRKSISAYYFSRGRPFRELLFGSQGVLFDGASKPSLVGRMQGLGRGLAPPVLYDVARAGRRRPNAGGQDGAA